MFVGSVISSDKFRFGGVFTWCYRCRLWALCMHVSSVASRFQCVLLVTFLTKLVSFDPFLILLEHTHILVGAVVDQANTFVKMWYIVVFV